MRRTAIQLALAVLLAGVLSAPASAATILAAPAGSVSASSSAYDISTSSGDISCTASFSGNLAPSISASSGASWGGFTSGGLSSCIPTGPVIGPPYLILFSLPSVQTVRSILGTPPNITGVLVTRTNVTLSFNVLGVTCLYSGTVGYLAPFVSLLGGARAVGTFTALAGSTIPKIFGPISCPSFADMSRTNWLYSTLQSVNII